MTKTSVNCPHGHPPTGGNRGDGGEWGEYGGEMAGNGWIQVWLARGRLDPGMAGPRKAGSRYGWPAVSLIQVWLHPGGPTEQVIEI